MTFRFRINYKMNTRLLLLILISFIIAYSADAQKNKGSRKVHSKVAGIYLDNGSIIIGKLVNKSKPGVSIKVEGGDSLFIPTEQIKRIKSYSDGFSFTSRGRYNVDKGLYCSIYPLVLFYGNTRPGPGPISSGSGSQVILGRHHNARLSYGLMTGIATTDSYDEETKHPYWFTGVTLAGIVNFNINLTGPRLYFTSKLGHTFILHRSKWDEDINLGLYGSFGLGVAVPSRYLPRFVIEVERVYIKTSGLTGSSTFNGVEVIAERFSKAADYVTVKIGIGLGQ